MSTVPFNSNGAQPFTRTEPMITVKQLKERYLFGIDLTDRQGNEIPSEVFQHQINSAVSYLEHALDVVISPVSIEGEQYDYRAVDYANFNFIQLKKRPVIDVTIIKAQFPNRSDLVTYPKQWYVVENESAQIQLSPVEGSFSGLIVTQGGSYVPLIYGTRDYWPHLFSITYKAGFCDDQIPVIINEMIGLQAAIKMFEMLGDLLYGPGISSTNTAIDGASVSRGLATSGIYSVFGARIDGYRKSLKDYMDVIKKYYNGIPSIVG